jgi:hypothetical protein
MSEVSSANGAAAKTCNTQQVEPRCAACRHRLHDRQAIEQRVAGLAVFGSAYGASIGASRLCVLHDRLISPNDRCAQFSPLS